MMITGEGGFIHRMMPPVDWGVKKIPEWIFNKELSRSDIFQALFELYLEDSNVKLLAGSDEPSELWRAKMALEILAEFDAEVIWTHNQF